MTTAPRERIGSADRHLRAPPSKSWLRAAAAAGTAHVADVVIAACGGEAAVTDLPEPDGGWADPFLIGQVHETGATVDEQRRRGAWYTPVPVVTGLLSLATAGRAGLPRLVVDPCCGGGAFLVGTLELLRSRGLSPEMALDRVRGIDADPSAVAATSLALIAWGVREQVPELDARARVAGLVEVGDSLGPWPADWPEPDLIVGNPPYASPLKSGAVDGSTADFHRSHTDRLGPYADVAAMHLLRAVEQLGPRGRVVLVLPQSIVSGRDTAVLRRWLEHAAPAVAVWATTESVFAASVRVWAPVLERAGGTSGITVANGPDVTPVGVVPPSDWADLTASALGIPTLDRIGPPLGDRITATSGFRDEFYGLVAACREAKPGDGPENAMLPVLTSGSIDPLVSWWGLRPTKLGGTTYRRPVIDLDALDDRTKRWVRQNRRPKILLPTQTKIFEPVIDRTGDLIGATPVVIVHGDADALDHIAALLLAPPVVAWAARRFVGSGMSVESIRLAAKHVAALPTPIRSEPWNRAAKLVASGYPGMPKVDRRALLDQIAVTMNTAFDASSDVLNWWRSRAR